MKRLTTRCDGRPALAQGYEEKFTESSLLFMLLNSLAAYEATMPLERAQELAQAEKEGRLVVLPCKVGDEAFVDVRTLPYHYLHPADGCIDYAKCEIVSIVTTKKEAYMKLRALYPSRAGRREYLRYGVSAVGKTVFLSREEAEAALKKEGGSKG